MQGQCTLTNIQTLVQHLTHTFNQEPSTKSIENLDNTINDFVTKCFGKLKAHVKEDVMAQFERCVSKRVSEIGVGNPTCPRLVLEEDLKELETRDCKPLISKIKTCSRHVRIQRLLVGDQLKKWRDALQSISASGTSYPAHLGAEDTGCKTLASTYDVWNCCVWYCGDDFSQVLERSSIREISQLQSQRDRLGGVSEMKLSLIHI